ncbi:MAG: DUF285 domain-containing protein [Succinivibrionaceae bacterium]|nr:DUF285 domain-containing protein [Succinivibrionaceae bacterium]
MALRQKDKEDFFRRIQEAFFLHPSHLDGMSCREEGGRCLVTWDIRSGYDWGKAPPAVRKALGELPPGQELRFGAVTLPIARDPSGAGFTLHSADIKVEVEPRFSAFSKAEMEVLTILARRCIDYAIVRERLHAAAGEGRLRLVPADALALRVFINSQGVPLGDLDTSGLTDLSYAFALYEGNNLLDNKRKDFSGIESWDTSKVISMYGTFAGCVHFNHDLSAWDTSHVQRFDVMFAGCKRFNQPLSTFNTSSATSMKGMLYKCQAFDQDLSGFDTSKVTDMSLMFLGCHAFSHDLSGWDTSKVKADNDIFLECELDEACRPHLPSTDAKLQYYKKYIGPDSKAYAREELYKRIGLAAAVIILVVVVTMVNQG